MIRSYDPKLGVSVFFKKNVRLSEAQLDSKIRDMLTRSDFERIPGADAAVYNNIGDLCNDAGYRERALSYWGDAIDAYLKVERWDAAAAICRKILRISPTAIRARCTLAWLAIGKGMSGEASQLIHDYADAAVYAGRDHLAVSQLKRMGDAAASPPIRQAVAETLLQLGADQAADYFFGLINRNTNTTPRTESPDRLWAAVRHAALLGPTQLAN